MAKLKYEEVRQRVLAASSEVVDDLCQLGESLVRDGLDRIEKANGQARALAAYCAGIVTLCMSSFSLWGTKLSRPFQISAALGIFGLILAAWFYVRTTFPVPTEWHSDDDWLRNEVLGSKEQMRRYRVLTMWKIIESLDGAHRGKERKTNRATWVMQLAFAFLLAAFLQVAWRIASV